MFIRTAILTSAWLAAACQASFQTAPHELNAWTTDLRATQPPDSYVAVHRNGDVTLAFVAAKHSLRTDSLTFRVINEAFAELQFDVLIVEGFPNAWGPNAERMLHWADTKSENDGYQDGGEAVPSIRGALRTGAAVWGGEPDDGEIRDRLLAQGFSRDDLLGFYTLRTVPQWLRERKIESASEPGVVPLIEQELRKNRVRLGFDDAVLPAYEDWALWYERTNGQPFGVGFTPEEAGPLLDGPYGSNRLAAGISRARAEFLHELVIGHLNAGKSTIVVFGASHYLLHRPALDHVLGPPCYIGTSLSEARLACSR